ncbi:MAG: prepilin peptidase [Anaerolineae bacterium]|nr:prepilin peptidase [Anaerolineae bacterium]
MNVSSMVVSGLLSLLWIALAVQDIRTHRLDNVGTLSAFALALGFQLGSSADWRYGTSLLACIVLALVIYSTGLIGGGDAKLLLSVLAWRPAMETGIVVLVCLAVIGGAALIWSRLRRETASRRYPLGGAISAAGMIVLWAL